MFELIVFFFLGSGRSWVSMKEASWLETVEKWTRRRERLSHYRWQKECFALKPAIRSSKARSQRQEVFKRWPSGAIPLYFFCQLSFLDLHSLFSVPKNTLKLATEVQRSTHGFLAHSFRKTVKFHKVQLAQLNSSTTCVFGCKGMYLAWRFIFQEHSDKPTWSDEDLHTVLCSPLNPSPSPLSTNTTLPPHNCWLAAL